MMENPALNPAPTGAAESGKDRGSDRADDRVTDRAAGRDEDRVDDRGMDQAPDRTADLAADHAESGLIVSAEWLSYAALATLAAMLRLFDLGWLPLDQGEAALSLPAWQAASGLPLPVVPGAPLLFQLQQLAFWLFHGGEGVARLVPALAGLVLVLAAWGLRPAFGRPAALATAALFALSPAWVFYGRSVAPAGLSAALAVLLLGLVVSGGRRGRIWVPIAAGLLVTSGGVAITLAVAGLLCWLLLRARGEQAALTAKLDELWSAPADRRWGAAAFGLTVVLAATGLALRPEGFAALIQVPAAFVAQAAAGLGPVQGMLLPLLAYVPVTLVFGLVGLLAAWRLPSPLGRLLPVWVLVGVLAAMLAGPATLADVLLPLTLAAGLALGRLWESVAEAFQWREEGVMTIILLVVAAYSLVTAFSAVSEVQGAEEAQLRLLGGLAVMGILALVYFFLWGAPTTLRVLGLTWLVLGGILAWSSGVALNYRPSLVVAEPLRPSFVTPDAARLAADLRSAALVRYRDPAAIRTVVDPALEPVLAWQLRELRDLDWAEARGQLDRDAVITPAAATGGEEPAFGPAPYLGRRYLVSGTFVPTFLAPGATDPWLFLRWLLRREPPRGPTVGGGNVMLEPASLYLKVDDEVNP